MHQSALFRRTSSISTPGVAAIEHFCNSVVSADPSDSQRLRLTNFIWSSLRQNGRQHPHACAVSVVDAKWGACNCRGVDQGNKAIDPLLTIRIGTCSTEPADPRRSPPPPTPPAIVCAIFTTSTQSGDSSLPGIASVARCSLADPGATVLNTRWSVYFLRV